MFEEIKSEKLTNNELSILKTLFDDINSIKNQDLINYINQLLNKTITEEFKQDSIYTIAINSFNNDILQLLDVCETLDYNEFESNKINKLEHIIETYDMIITYFEMWSLK